MDISAYFIAEVDNKYPFTFIDAGAMGGVPLKWSKILRAMNIIAFEPDDREFQKLKDSGNIKYLNCVLHSESTDLNYYITKGSGKSSIFEPNMGILSQYEDSDRFKVIKEEVIPSAKVKTLDSAIGENLIADVDFIKLDTQGSELLILKGGQKQALRKSFGIQIETEFIEIYKNQPLFHDVDKFMNNTGFQLVDLRRIYWKRKDYYRYPGHGQLIFGDALYFKKIDAFYQELSGCRDKSYARSKIFKSILTCIVYRSFDYAVSLVKTAFERGYLSDNEYERIISGIKRYSWKGFFLLLQEFRLRSYLGWVGSDQEIGNIEDR